MLITESQLGTGFGRSGMALLENMSYLTEKESQYHAAMVPVVENTDIGANIVALEDIMRFAESNGIDDLGYALSCVCEASDITADTVVFSVQETNVIANDDTAELVRDIMNEGVGVVARPISENDIMYELAEASCEALLYGYDELLEAYVNDDYYAITGFLEANRYEQHLMATGQMPTRNKNGKWTESDIRRARQKNNESQKGPETRTIAERKQEAQAKLHNRNARKEAEAREMREEAKKKARGIVEKQKLSGMVKDEVEKLKNPQKVEVPQSEDKTAKLADANKKIEEMMRADRPNVISRAIASLNRWAEKLRNNNSGDDKGIISKILAKIGQAIQYLTNKLGAEKARTKEDAYQAYMNSKS